MLLKQPLFFAAISQRCGCTFGAAASRSASPSILADAQTHPDKLSISKVAILSVPRHGLEHVEISCNAVQLQQRNFGELFATVVVPHSVVLSTVISDWDGTRFARPHIPKQNASQCVERTLQYSKVYVCF